MRNYDLVVIGSGPAGLGAAVYAHDKGIKSILVIERDRELGGILQQCIHNGFGLHEFREDLTGPEYAQRFIDMLHDREIAYLLDTMVLDVDESKTIHAVSKSEGYMTIQAKAVIFAMGCREWTRGALSIPGTRPAGVFTAGTAQRYINMEGYMVGRKVVILGSGDIGLIMARRLTLEGADVLAVVEINPFSSGLTRNIVQCLDDYGIPLYLNHTVTRIEGRHRVESVTVSYAGDQHTNAGDMHIKCDTLLLSVGLIPENELTEGLGATIDRATKGPVVDDSMETSIPGIFACGNVVQVHDLVDHVTEESRRAAQGAAAYLKKTEKEHKPDKKNTLPTKAGQGIGYIVPQHINMPAIHREDTINCSFRVKAVYKEADLVAYCGEKEIRRIRKKIMTPGEMESLTFKREELSEGNALTIEVEVGQ